MNKPTNSKKSHKAAWQGYTPSRKEWMRRKLHDWWIEFLIPWIVLGPILCFVLLYLIFGGGL